MTHPSDATPSGPFELSGGALCLDFANTWGNQTDPGSDDLRTYEQLLAFARQTGFLTADAAAPLSRAAGGDPAAAAAALSLSLDLRGVIYRIFSRRAAGRSVPGNDVDRVNAVVGEALSHRRLERREGYFVWTWIAVDADHLHAPIWPVIVSAAQLLTSDDLERVRECHADDCNWLFLDRSRNATRRWCSMSTCGNRAKARRRYKRQRRG